MKRLLAVVVALAMVGIALYIRSARDDDSTGVSSSGPTRLVCAKELVDICEDLPDAEVTVEDVETTLSRLAGSRDPGFDAWLVFDPWPEMVQTLREREGLPRMFSGDRTVLARSPLAGVGLERLTACGWRCLGDQANDQGLRLGIPDLRGGIGPLVVGAAVAGYFNNSRVATNDFTLDPAFSDWLSTLVAGVRSERSPVLSLLQSRANADVAISTEADAKRLFEVATPDRKAGLALFYPGPVASVDVVLAGGPESLSQELSERLLAGGWSPPAPGPTGLPSAGVLLALRDQL